MRIEDITKERLAKASDKELLILKLRQTQLFDKNFKDNDNIIVGSLNRNKFLKNYRLLLNEMTSRKIEKSTSAIDRATFKKSMIAKKFGVDVSDFEDVVVMKDCVVVEAGSVNAEAIADIVKSRQDDLTEIVAQCQLEPAGSSYIPMYDLVLKAKQKTEVVKVAKKIWSARFINSLPDSAFLYIESGGKKDDEGKTKPRKLRHFPYRDNEGKVDLPHLRNALARIPQSKLPKTVKDKVTAKATKILDDIKEEKQFEKSICVYQLDKAHKDERIVGGIVYEPDVVDAQGDKANEVEIRKAAYKFMEDVQAFKVMHKGKAVKVKVLESYIAPVDLTVESTSIKKGTWLITVRVLEKKIWDAVKSGELTGFSMAGYAKTS